MYCDVADVQAVLSATGAADTASPASLPVATVQMAIDEARAEVDARLGARYDVPFDDPRLGDAIPVPMVVRNITRDLAAYKLLLTFFRNAPVPDGHPTLLRFQAANGLLSNLVNGTAKLQLANSPAGDQPAQVNAAPYNLQPGPLFTVGDFGMRYDVRRGGMNDLPTTY